MYNRDRRGYAQAQQVSDDAARDHNLTLMQQKRKKQLEEQLEMKLDTQRQYANPRGIGQRGGPSVPQRDMDILQEQIDTIRRQLAEMNGQAPSGYSSQFSSMPATPHSQMGGATPPSASGRTPQFQQPQQQGYAQQPQSGGRAPMQPAMPGNLNVPAQNGQRFQPGGMGGPPSNRGPEGTPLAQVAGRPAQPGSAGRPMSKREQVWNAKYQRWLHREREASRQSNRSGAGGAPTVPPLQGGPMPGAGFAPVPLAPVAGRRASQTSDMGFTPPSAIGGQTPMGSDAVRFGRRATPPSEAQRPPVAPMQAGHLQQQQAQQPPPWQQQQQSQQRGYGQQQQQQQGPPPQQQLPQGRRGNQSSSLW